MRAVFFVCGYRLVLFIFDWKYIGMKGIIFTEFLELVEEKFGLEMVDAIISENDLASGGAYTAVGTYDHGEMVKLVISLSAKCDIPVDTLLVVYGEYLFGTFVKSYGHFIEASTDAFSILASVESYIHVEVQKLYNDAELPSFNTSEKAHNVMEMIYKSERKLSGVAEGLVIGCLKHYGEEGTVKREMIKEDGSEVKITVTKV